MRDKNISTFPHVQGRGGREGGEKEEEEEEEKATSDASRCPR